MDNLILIWITRSARLDPVPIIILTLKALNEFVKKHRNQGFFYLVIITNDSVSSFRFIWIPMLAC